LDKTSKTRGVISDFVAYAVNGFVDELKDQLAIIRDQQWDMTWRNYVHETFKDQTSEAALRLRHLALDLSMTGGAPVRIAQIPEISARMATAYAKKTRKTLVRDVKKLVETGLLVHGKDGVRAKREAILAFLPARRFS